jgi:hypothetical protein
MAELCLPVRGGVSNVYPPDFPVAGFSNSFPSAMTGVTNTGRESFCAKITDQTEMPGNKFSGISMNSFFKKSFHAKEQIINDFSCAERLKPGVHCPAFVGMKLISGNMISNNPIIIPLFYHYRKGVFK